MMLKNKYFADLLKVCSILPALAIMPAMAVEITEDTTLTDGTITDGLKSTNGKKGTLNASTIDISSQNSASVSVSGSGSALELGIDKNTTDITIHNTNRWGAWLEGGKLSLGNKNADVKIISEQSGGITAAYGSAVDITANSLTLNSAYMGIQVYSNSNRSSVNINANDVTMSTTGDKAQYVIVAMGGKGADVNVNAKNITLSNSYDGSRDAGYTAVVHSGNGSAVNLTADEIRITGPLALASMSSSSLDLVGNVYIDSEKILTTRGGATTNINVAGDKIVQMNGDLNFDYDEETSGSTIDANVNIVLSGANSYWNGNTRASYTFDNPTDKTPDDIKSMSVTGTNLTLKDGAIWDATAIEENIGEYSGTYYVALNNLTVENGGIVHIMDGINGLTIDNATIDGANIWGGTLRINDSLTVKGGTSIIDGNLMGADAALDIQEGSVLDMGKHMVKMKSINLDGTMIVTLDDHGDDGAITTESFDGNGALSLVVLEENTYHVFGDAVFANTDIGSAMYKLEWLSDSYVKTIMKEVEEIAEDNNVSMDAALTATRLMSSSSNKLKDFGALIQERMILGDTAAVEHAHKAVNPEETSVAQSVAGHVQGTVSKLAAGRMSMPRVAPASSNNTPTSAPNTNHHAMYGTVGRPGGDVNMTHNGVWAQGLYNKSKLNGDFRGYTRGIAAGIDGTFEHAFTLGAGYAFNHSDMSLASRGLEIDSNTVFAYGQYKPNNWYVNATVNYTLSDYKESANALGVAINADYKLHSFGAVATTGYDFASGITPEFGIRYMHIGEDTYVNSLDVHNKIDAADYLTSVLGVRYGKTLMLAKDLALRPDVHAAVKYDLMSDDAINTVTMPGIDAYIVNGKHLKRTAGEVGLGVAMMYGDVDISLNYDIEVRKDYTSQTGMVRARYNF